MDGYSKVLSLDVLLNSRYCNSEVKNDDDDDDACCLQCASSCCYGGI